MELLICQFVSHVRPYILAHLNNEVFQERLAIIKKHQDFAEKNSTNSEISFEAQCELCLRKNFKNEPEYIAHCNSCIESLDIEVFASSPSNDNISVLNSENQPQHNSNLIHTVFFPKNSVQEQHSYQSSLIKLNVEEPFSSEFHGSSPKKSKVNLINSNGLDFEHCEPQNNSLSTENNNLSSLYNALETHSNSDTIRRCTNSNESGIIDDYLNSSKIKLNVSNDPQKNLISLLIDDKGSSGRKYMVVPDYKDLSISKIKRFLADLHLSEAGDRDVSSDFLGYIKFLDAHKTSQGICFAAQFVSRQSCAGACVETAITIGRDRAFLE